VAGSTKVQLALADLVDRGVLVVTDEGYAVADPVFVELARTLDATQVGLVATTTHGQAREEPASGGVREAET
jgi:hypothetical protein